MQTEVRPVIIFHIGAAKTGSSALQFFFAKNREFLERNKIYYPELAMLRRGVDKAENGEGEDFASAEYGNGLGLSRYDRPYRELNRYQRGNIKKIARLAKKKRKLLISDEFIWMYRNDRFHILHNFLREGVDVKVIIYIRRQDEMIESLWNQMVQSMGMTQTCSEYAAAAQHPYYACLDAISGLIGKANLMVRVYDKAQFAGKQKNIFSDFTDALGFELEDRLAFPPLKKNPSLGPDYLAIMLLANRACQNVQFRKRLGRAMLAFSAAELSGDKITHAAHHLEPAMRKRVLDSYAEENARIAREYFGTGGPLFSLDGMDAEPVKPSEGEEFYRKALIAAFAAADRQTTFYDSKLSGLMFIRRTALYRLLRKCRKTIARFRMVSF